MDKTEVEEVVEVDLEGTNSVWIIQFLMAFSQTTALSEETVHISEAEVALTKEH